MSSVCVDRIYAGNSIPEIKLTHQQMRPGTDAHLGDRLSTQQIREPRRDSAGRFAWDLAWPWGPFGIQIRRPPGEERPPCSMRAHTHTAHPITIRRCACAYHTCARVHTDYDTARAGVGTYACWTLVKMRGEKTSEFALSIVMHVRLGWDGTRTGRNREREIDACETMSRLGLALTGHGGTAHSAPPPYLIFPLF